MKTFNLKKIAAITSTVTIVMVAIGFGCGLGFQPIGESGELASVNSTNVGLGSNEANGFTVKPSAPTTNLPIYTNLYGQILNVLQLPAPTAANDPLRVELNRQIGSLSDSGSPLTVTAPFVFATTALSAAGCNARITLESAAGSTKVFFNSINLAAAPAGNVTDAALADVINRLARSAWQRNETAEERTMLTTAVKASMDLDAGNNATETREAMLYLCTAMLASTDGFRQ